MIRIQGLNLSVGSFALQGIDLQVERGEYFVLLGPTGSGKTLLLECLCGLNRIDSGRIWIDEQEVTHWEPRRRGTGYLPQDYALFPRKTVWQNVAFGLSRRGVSRHEAAERVNELLAQLGLEHLAHRLPDRLSGGEKQRVALARALVVRPRVLLLDEPVAAVDEATREALCRLLKHLQRQIGTTTIHVCHNFAEMLAVADRAAVIDQGRVLQVGTPREILQHPCNRRMADFVQAGNILPVHAQAEGDRLCLECADGVRLWAAGRLPAQDSGLLAVIRPENVRLAPERPAKARDELSGWEATVREVVDQGFSVKVRLGCGRTTELIAQLGRPEALELQLHAGQRVWAAVRAEDVHVMADNPDACRSGEGCTPGLGEPRR